MNKLQQWLSFIFKFLSCLVKVFLISSREAFHFLLPRYKDISGDIILITGGGRGIGRRLALDFTDHNPKHIVVWGRDESWLKKTCADKRNKGIVVWGRDEGWLKKTCVDIRNKGVQSSYFKCDVSSRDQVYSTAEAVRQTVGNVSILVNNAGTVHGQQVQDMSCDDFEHSLKVNTLAHIWTIKAFLPSMIEANHGHIVCMCSTLGLMGLKGTADYSSSKFALTGLMEAMAWELEEYNGIYTTTIYPYQVNNDMFAGCQVRFPRLFPQLTETSVSKGSLKAILTNRRKVVMPWYFYPVTAMKSILPVSCLYPALRFLGLHTMMDTLGSKKHS